MEKKRHAVDSQQVADAKVSELVMRTVEGGKFIPHRSLVVRPDFRNAKGRMGYRGRIHLALDVLADSRRAVTMLGDSSNLRTEGGKHRVQMFCQYSQVDDAEWGKAAELNTFVREGVGW